MTTMYNPTSPGELLREFLGDITATRLAEHIGIARATISPVLNGRTAISTDLSIRLGEALSLSPDFFSKAQLQHDLWIESQKKRPKIKPLPAYLCAGRLDADIAEEESEVGRGTTVGRVRLRKSQAKFERYVCLS